MAYGKITAKQREILEYIKNEIVNNLSVIVRETKKQWYIFAGKGVTSVIPFPVL